jgi:hypothetical protein
MSVYVSFFGYYRLTIAVNNARRNKDFYLMSRKKLFFVIKLVPFCN